jgi:hypothetical protein
MDIPDELTGVALASLEQRDRYILGVVQGHKRLPSRNGRYALRGQSLFKFLAPFWWALTTEQKNIWKAAGVISTITGWQLFISDSAQRIRNDMDIGNNPSLLWQVRIGYITIESPADHIVLRQIHPRDYWIVRKKRGQPWKKELAQVREFFNLPLELEVRYRANLTPVGGEQVCRLYAAVWTSYQGVDYTTKSGIDLDPDTDWVHETAEISELRGIIVAYELWIEIRGYQGEILFDNIRAIHSATNWARDPRFDNMSQTFVKQYAIVQPFWEPIEQPAGAQYRTVFEPLVET